MPLSAQENSTILQASKCHSCKSLLATKWGIIPCSQTTLQPCVISTTLCKAKVTITSTVQLFTAVRVAIRDQPNGLSNLAPRRETCARRHIQNSFKIISLSIKLSRLWTALKKTKQKKPKATMQIDIYTTTHLQAIVPSMRQLEIVLWGWQSLLFYSSSWVFLKHVSRGVTSLCR